ncbi:MAG: hypothetical protein LBV47_06800 [Bacteroidales bacterium]|jgi:hypothetical protein|nr:hypothetical protein [Bacteroidales bacterium]
MIRKINYLRYTISFIVLLFATTVIAEAQIEVSTLAGDDSRGSLVAAIKAANERKADPANPVVIRFDKKLEGEIVLSMDLPNITNHISVIGNVVNGKPAITVNGVVNAENYGGLLGGASPGFRLFFVTSGQTVSFENLIMTKSNNSGIRNEGGDVTVKNCMFTYNLGFGQEYGTAGAVHSEGGSLVVIGSYFFYNNGGVGGVEGGPGFGGSGSINVVDGNAVIMNSSFFENEGGFGGVGVGSVAGPGMLMARGSNVTVINCTVANNFGGGSIVTGASGGIVMLGTNMLILQSTIVDNIGGAGLGGFDGIDFCSGGIHVLSGTLTLGGNIFAGNKNGNDIDTDIETQRSGEILSLGRNLFGYANVEINGTGDVKGILMKDVVATTPEGRFKSEATSGILSTIALTANSPAKNKSTKFTDISPVAAGEANTKFFADVASKYSSLLQADQNGKQRAANPSIGAVE